jgi:RNA polymerase sigma-54 factor
MSLLSPRLQLKVAQKQILTPGLVQMVTVLQLNRLELKEMINQEIVNNPVLEEATEETAEEVTAEEILSSLETDRMDSPADQQILESTNGTGEHAADIVAGDFAPEPNLAPDVVAELAEGVTPLDTVLPQTEETPPASDPFDEIDFGSFFDDYLDPGYKSPAAESVEKPSFETFLSAPLTLGDHLRSQLSVSLLPDEIRDAAETIIGNLDEDGYLTASLDEIGNMGQHTPE